MKLYQIDLLAHVFWKRLEKLPQPPRNFSVKELELYANDYLENLYSQAQQ
jgi:hypothetical protein